jgi:hypothetical protein
LSEVEALCGTTSGAPLAGMDQHCLKNGNYILDVESVIP